MTRTEFMSLLQYYLKKSSAEETADIIADYNAHFDVAEDAGFSDEDIIKELDQIDLYQLTPMQAMNVMYELKVKMNQRK